MKWVTLGGSPFPSLVSVEAAVVWGGKADSAVGRDKLYNQLNPLPTLRVLILSL